jgi:beta-glucosidase
MNNYSQNQNEHSFANDLLKQMSLDQKIGQMTQPERMAITPREVRDYHIGSVLSGGGSCPGDNRPADWVKMNDAYWMASMKSDADHLAIPLIYGIDAIHGNANVLGATVFPHNIGLGATNNPDLIERIAAATAKEILATGVDWTFAPTLAVARDYHWGRTYESYSEDPAHVARFADRFVAGMQNDLGDNGVVACAKHWVGDGGTRNGIDQGETTLSIDQLRRLHIGPYLPALEEGVQTVMASFNSWNGDKCHGHRKLITDVLKEQLQFDGFVVSDWDGIDYLSEDYGEAVALSVNAGIDMFMVSVEWKAFIGHVRDHVESGRISIERIDDAVRRILIVKHRFGLFEKPRPNERRWSNDACFGSVAHRELAREAARESLVLLKNDNDVLPLAKSSKILVAGRNADNRGAQCGGFTVEWQGTIGNEKIEGGASIWEGIKATSPDAELCIDGSAADPGLHDAAIIVIGENPYAEGMGDVRDGDSAIVEAGSMIKGLLKTLEPYGRSLLLSEMHPEDLATIERVAATGLSIVCVLISGRPLGVDAELALSDAFVAAWLPGSEGQGVADVLFGEQDFKGRLSFTWPRDTTATLNLGDDDYDPLFPLGYGLT